MTIGTVGNGTIEPGEKITHKREENTIVTLTVSDEFVKWRGPDADDVKRDKDGYYYINMDGNKSITAVFTTDIAVYITDFIAYDSEGNGEVLASTDELIVDDDTGAGINDGKFNDHFEVINGVVGPYGENIDVLYVTTDFDNSVCIYPGGADYSNTSYEKVEFYVKVFNEPFELQHFLNYTENYYACSYDYLLYESIDGWYVVTVDLNTFEPHSDEEQSGENSSEID